MLDVRTWWRCEVLCGCGWWWWLFPRLRGFGECSTVHSTLALFIFIFLLLLFIYYYFFCKVKISSGTLILLFRPGSIPSGSELRRLWPNVPWQVACELDSGYVSTRCLDKGIASLLRIQWVKGVWVYRCKLPLALLTEWPGSFTCYCCNTGVERTRNKSQHTKLTLEKRFLPRHRSCWDSNSQPFDHESGALTNKLFRLPCGGYNNKDQTTVNKKAPIHYIIPINNTVHRPL